MAGHNDEHPDIHMPNPSYWPLVMSIGITLLVVGLVYSFYLSGLGLVIFFVSLIGWLREPTGLE